MKKLVFLLIILPILGFGQSITAPDSKIFVESTAAQNASGFILSEFNPNDILLASISLVTYPIGTTFYLGTTTGLTQAVGFTLTGNKVRLVVTGSMSNINNALASLKINTGATKGEIKISVAATINPTGYYYNGVNGHFYKPVLTGTYYKTARADALTTTFKGQTGYLVTITSADEDAFIQANVPAAQIWFAATDEVIDGTWVIDAGPEKGTVMKTSNGQFAGNRPGVYNNWASGEPNGYNHGEDYAVTKWNGSQWNDLYNQWNNPYVIEYGTWSNPDDQTFTGFITNSTSCSNGEVFSVKFNFNFGGNITKSLFSTKMYYTPPASNTLTQVTTNNPVTLNNLGKVDMTSDSDLTKSGTVVKFTPLSSYNLLTMYDEIITVSDVYLAFKEVSNKGLLGDQTGNEFTSGYQYLNGDVDSNGVFDESDCFRLLQHLRGDKLVVDNFTLESVMGLLERTSTVSKSNWVVYSNLNKGKYPVVVEQGKLAYNYNLNVLWKGDINLSHTPVEASVSKFNTLSSKTDSNKIHATIITEKLEDRVVATIKIDPLNEQVGGTQFRLNYDSTFLTYEKMKTEIEATNFSVNRGEYINLGSLLNENSKPLDKTAEYTLTFKLKQTAGNILGMISISNTDAVSKSGAQLKVIML